MIFRDWEESSGKLVREVLEKLISSVIFPWPPVVLTRLAKSSVAGASLLGVSSTAMPAGKTTTCQQSLVPRDLRR